MAFFDILKSIAPAIATALGGPLAGAAVSFLGDKLGIKDATLDKIQQTFAGMTGEQLVEMKKLDIDFQTKMAEIGISIDLAQISTNTEEAKSENWFVAGWRPAVGWLGALGLGYACIIEPLMRFIASVGFDYLGDYPVIDTSLTTTILIGILGLGGLRTLDKKWGNGNEAGKH